MKLLSYEEFGRLRLRQFCPKDDPSRQLTEEKGHSHFIQEKIGNVVFKRWFKRPDELAAVGIWADGVPSSGWPWNIVQSVLSVIGLRLQAGLSYEETAARFGTPPNWRSKDGQFAIFHTGGDSPYEVNCGFVDDMKLDRVFVRRLDMEIPPEQLLE